MTRLDDVASTGEDAPAPAPAPEVQMSTDCYEDPNLDGKAHDCGIPGLISCIREDDAGCKIYSCEKSGEICESIGGGENLGQPKHHSGALAWSTGFAAVTVAASTVAFL